MQNLCWWIVFSAFIFGLSEQLVAVLNETREPWVAGIAVFLFFIFYLTKPKLYL